MALTKVQAEGLNLADTFAFTGTVTGTNQGLVLLQTVTASDDATVTVGSSSLFTSTYKVYQIHVLNAHPATDSVEFRCRISTGGSVQTGSSYEYTRRQTIHSNSSITNRGSTSDALVPLAESLGNGANESHSGILTLYNPTETTFTKNINFMGSGRDLSPNTALNTVAFSFEGNENAIDGVQFFMNSGNVESGTFKLYGVV
tara:strand:+ start:175 stop:777 length:603 start_codon:yes stop_codon:yes gene_type:complete